MAAAVKKESKNTMLRRRKVQKSGGGDYILIDFLLLFSSLLHICKIWKGHGPPSPPDPPGFDIPAMVLPSCINRRMRQDLFPPFNARFALIFAYQIKIAEIVQH